MYSTNYDGATTTASGVTVAVTAGGGAPVADGMAGGIAGNYFRNDTTGLTEYLLTGVSGYSSFDIAFTLAFIDSWDSTDGSPSPDYLNILIDGVQVLQLTAANASGSVTFLGGGTQTALGDFFYSSGGFFAHDRVVDMSTAPALAFAHSGNTLRLSIQAGGAGYQGGTDESWGIDNLVVQGFRATTGVPEPGTWAMMIAGFGLVGGAMRRRSARGAVAAA